MSGVRLRQKRTRYTFRDTAPASTLRSVDCEPRTRMVCWLADCRPPIRKGLSWQFFRDSTKDVLRVSSKARIPGHALQGLQRYSGVGPLVSSQEQCGDTLPGRSEWVPRMWTPGDWQGETRSVPQAGGGAHKLFSSLERVEVDPGAHGPQENETQRNGL